MAKEQKVKVAKARQVNTYIEVWRTSYWTMQQAEEKEEGSYFQIMASLVFTAFTLEAYLNHLGQQIFNCWDDLEGLSPQKKLNVIVDKLELEKDDGKRPFQTVKRLFKFRNAVAHGKDISLKQEDEIRLLDDTIDEYMREPLETEWERYCTLDNAKKAREDVEIIVRKLHDKADILGDNLFISLPWSAHATLLNENEDK
jgi:hypothetical protein